MRTSLDSFCCCWARNVAFYGLGAPKSVLFAFLSFYVGFAFRSPVIPKTMRFIRLFGAKRIQFYPPQNRKIDYNDKIVTQKKISRKINHPHNKFFLAGERALPFNSFIRHAPIHRSHHPTPIHHHHHQQIICHR